MIDKNERKSRDILSKYFARYPDNFQVSLSFKSFARSADFSFFFQQAFVVVTVKGKLLSNETEISFIKCTMLLSAIQEVV